jgi:putative membrane protein
MPHSQRAPHGALFSCRDSVESTSMRFFVWLARAFIFFSLFAFALNNQQAAAVHWFFGYAWNAPMVIIVLAAFAGGTAFGVLAMAPSWWRQRRLARLGAPAAPDSPAHSPAAPREAIQPVIPDGV